MFPKSIHDAAASFDQLPGVGPRASLRYAYWLVSQPKEAIIRFAKAFEKLADGVTVCAECHAWADASPCDICRDPSRDQTVLCVVATSQNQQTIEETGSFHGRYHVLGGLLDPIEGRTPETINVKSLMDKLHDSRFPAQRDPATRDTFHELILAFDTDIPGDTTALYLRKQLTGLPIKITRLARGLPTGAALEYADAYTLADALKNRREN